VSGPTGPVGPGGRVATDGGHEPSNDRVADLFEEFADRLEATDVEYKPRAYRRAAENLRAHAAPLATLVREDPDAIEEVEGVGEAIAAKVVEYVETGSIDELERLREELPVEIGALTRVQGVGPKTVGTLYEALDVRTLDDLERAARDGEIREVRGFGEKTEQNILENVAFAREAATRRRLDEVRPLADDLLTTLERAPAVERCAVAGSIRRWRPTVGDVDLLVAAGDARAAVEAFLDLPAVESVVEAGEKKAAARAEGGRVDLRVVAPDEFGAALQYFTGSKDHNVRLRTEALERGISLNEYGAFRLVDEPDESAADTPPDAVETAPDGRDLGERVAGAEEAEMYAALDLPWIPPELREDRGEVEAARAGELPDLVEVEAVRGDLHTHTDASDGRASLDRMAEAAAARGHDFLGVTDHATGPGVPGGVGLPDDELREHVARVREADADAPVDLLAGVEANVDADGDLSVADDLLAELDLVVASPHSGLDGEATDRLVRAVEHPHVDVLGHPTGRLLGRRSGLTVDAAKLGAAAADAGVALEVNANPARLDLRGGAVEAALEAGATIAVNTDAHGPAEFDNVRYGIHTARRGWVEESDLLNARSTEGVRAFLDA
jgi:DNA polymerase (family 10)